MHDLECPYCGHEQDVCHDDGFGYEEGVDHKMRCAKCKKRFVFQTSISFHYEAAPADCLNGGKHDWAATHTYPTQFTLMKCGLCGESRTPTEDEMRMILALRTP